MNSHTLSSRPRRGARLRIAVVLPLVAAAVFLLWPRPPQECSLYGRAADYQSTPATVGTGVTCLR